MSSPSLRVHAKMPDRALQAPPAVLPAPGLPAHLRAPALLLPRASTPGVRFFFNFYGTKVKKVDIQIPPMLGFFCMKKVQYIG